MAEYILANIAQIRAGYQVEQVLDDAKKQAEKEKVEAARIGSAIHEWIEKFIKGENPEMPGEEVITRGVLSFLQWQEEHGVEFVASEKLVYSMSDDYVGTLDAIARFKKDKDKLFVIDFKTGNDIYAEAKLQTAAYLDADHEESGVEYAGRWILNTTKETEEQFKERMTKKNKPDAVYMPFRAYFLDADPMCFARDLKAFRATKALHQALKIAETELATLKNGL